VGAAPTALRPACHRAEFGDARALNVPGRSIDWSSSLGPALQSHRARRYGSGRRCAGPEAHKSSEKTGGPQQLFAAAISSLASKPMDGSFPRVFDESTLRRYRGERTFGKASNRNTTERLRYFHHVVTFHHSRRSLARGSCWVAGLIPGTGLLRELY